MGWVRRLRTIGVLVAVVALLVGLTAAVERFRRPAASPPAGPQLSLVAGRTLGAVPGPATASGLNGPQGVAVSDQGVIYIADTRENQVVRVSPAGRLTVVAGSGLPGQPTPGPAVRSALNQPAGVAVDPRGDVYIADTENDRVERVDTKGHLTVIAGVGTPGPVRPGPAAGAAIGHPQAVAAGLDGRIYIADGTNNTIDEISRTGRLSVAAGNGRRGPVNPGPVTVAPLGFPTGITVDVRNDLFITDDFDQRIEEVRSDGQLTFVAGTGLIGAPTPGPARDSRWSYPDSTAVDLTGDLYVSDQSGISKVTPGGTLYTVIRRPPDFPEPPDPETPDRLFDPTGLAIDPHGGLLIADLGNDQVTRLDRDGRSEVVAGTGYDRATPSPGPALGAGLGNVGGVAVGPDGSTYATTENGQYSTDAEVVGVRDGRLTVIAGRAGPVGMPTPGPATASRLGSPHGIAVDAQGDVFVADTGASVVEEISPAGRLSIAAGQVGHPGLTVPGPAATSVLGRPGALALDPAGDLYIAEDGEIVERTVGGTVRVVAGGAVHNVVCKPGLDVRCALLIIGALAIGPGGDLYISTEDGILRLDAAGHIGLYARAAAPGYPMVKHRPFTAASDAIAFDARGDLFAADPAVGVIDEIKPGGVLTVVAGDGNPDGGPAPGPALATSLGYVGAIGFAPDGALLVADIAPGVIYRIGLPPPTPAADNVRG